MIKGLDFTWQERYMELQTRGSKWFKLTWCEVDSCKNFVIKYSFSASLHAWKEISIILSKGEILIKFKGEIFVMNSHILMFWIWYWNIKYIVEEILPISAVLNYSQERDDLYLCLAGHNKQWQVFTEILKHNSYSRV